MDLPGSKMIPFLCSFCGHWERKVTCLSLSVNAERQDGLRRDSDLCHVFSLSKGDKISSLLSAGLSLPTSPNNSCCERARNGQKRTKTDTGSKSEALALLRPPRESEMGWWGRGGVGGALEGAVCL